MTDSHNRFLGNRALSPETLMMGYGYDPFLSERSLKPPIFQTSSTHRGLCFHRLSFPRRRSRLQRADRDQLSFSFGRRWSRGLTF